METSAEHDLSRSIGPNERQVAPAQVLVTSKPRLDFIDNLRWVMIVLVVSMHAAVTYSHIGSWYFMEPPEPDLLTKVFFATYQAFLQAFFMGLLFLVAGYFVPGALERKGFRKFALDRGVRLLIPAFLFMLFIQPVAVYWLLGTFADHSRPSLSKAYWPYLSSGRVLSGSGPMWFTLALFLFSIVYGLFRSCRPKAVRPDLGTDLPTHGQVIGLIIVMSVCTFLVRTVQPIGTNILNMQLCFFSQYILLFLVGVHAWRRDWLLRVPSQFGMRWFKLALIGGTLAWFAFALAVVKTKSEAQVSGGFTWQSAGLSIWESFFCVGVCLGLLVLFREKFNRRGRITRWLSDNCFAVYFFHTPVLIAVTLAVGGFGAPKPVKFLCASILGVTLTYLASSLVLRRIPILKRVL